MSNSVSTRVWRESVQTKTRRLLLVKIADNVNNDGFGFAGNDYLAENTLISVRQVQRLIDQIQSTGELYVRPGNGRTKKNATLITIGLDHAGIKNRLETYFEMSPEQAENVTLSILKGRQDYVTLLQSRKGDISKPERVTKSTGKGDISSVPKGDEAASEAVTSSVTVLTGNTLTGNQKTLAPIASAPVPPVESKPVDPPIPELPDPPKGKAWVSSSEFGTQYAHLVKASNVDRSRALCKASIRHRSRCTPTLGARQPCPDCLTALSEPKVTERWPQYGALMVLVRKYAFAGDAALSEIAGRRTKALLTLYPDCQPDEFERFAEQWPPGLNFPSNDDSLPTSFGLWRAKQRGSTTENSERRTEGVLGDGQPKTQYYIPGPGPFVRVR